MRILLKSGISILLFFLIFQSVHAQNISIPDTLKGWDHTWMASLHGSQATYTNWSQGGASSISGAASSSFTLFNRKNRRAYGLRVTLKYGQAYVDKEGIRKTEDVLTVRNRLTNNLREEKKLAVYASTRFETQFQKGYDYGKGVAGTDSLISDFISPASLTESVGIAFAPDDYFTTEIGVGLKQTIVADDSLTQNYGLDPGENFRSEGGLSTGFNFQKEIFPDILYAGSFETFTNLLNGLKKTDISWTNEFKGEINKMVSATFQFEMKYDNDFSNDIQLKQVLSVGLSVDLF